MIALVVASTICKLDQCSFCKNIDPDSWAWIFSGCWIFSNVTFEFGLALTAALLIASGYRAMLGASR